MTISCSQCGASGTGKFCRQCGAALAAASIANDAVRARERRAWSAAVGALVILAGAVAWAALRRPAANATQEAQAAAPLSEEGTPPDLSTMSPRERFDRLYNRVMRASEQGDSATVRRFSPMAFLAYEQLDTVDADARYHVAVLRLHVQADTAAALRLADSIALTAPRHLFVFLIRGTAGRLAGDPRLLARANADFLAAWDAEIQEARPEYRDHQTMLDRYREMARSSRP